MLEVQSAESDRQSSRLMPMIEIQQRKSIGHQASWHFGPSLPLEMPTCFEMTPCEPLEEDSRLEPFRRILAPRNLALLVLHVSWIF